MGQEEDNLAGSLCELILRGLFLGTFSARVFQY